MRTWPLPVLAGATFLLLLLGYRGHWAWPAGVDAAALSAGYDAFAAHPGWVRFWTVVSAVFAPVTFRLAAMVVAVVAALRHRVRDAVFLLVAVETDGWLTYAAKHAVNRPRPATALVPAGSSSFPSGHALGALVGVAALLVVLLPLCRGLARPALLAAGAVIVAAVGVARVALNVHHPSDVLAGWALGAVYVWVWAVLLRPGAAAGVDRCRGRGET